MRNLQDATGPRRDAAATRKTCAKTRCWTSQQWHACAGVCCAVACLVWAAPAAAQEPVWDLVWSDEFDGTSVDTDNWELITLENSHNNEKQYYLPQQASIVDGNLRITATNQPIAGKQYRSARLESWDTFGPGRFEARIDLPTTQGMWPAFWIFPNSGVPWPQGGEIDILENRGSQPYLVSSAYHWQTNPGPCCDQHQYVYDEYTATEGGDPVNFHSGFHTYAAEWDEEEIRFYVDGNLYFHVLETTNRPIIDTPKNIILNLAVGGDFGGDPNGSTVFPQYMDVDYVRVWERSTGLPGDFNGDDVVDADDYTVWRNAKGTPTALPNDPTPGSVDQSDYIVWRDHYGESLGAGAGGGLSANADSSVPEPTTLFLLLLGSLAIFARLACRLASR